MVGDGTGNGGGGGALPTGEVHPVAGLFPMLPDDELEELADDIGANGLRHPIVLDASGVLIDGRNRWAACQMAGIEPRFEVLNGEDPVAYILSSNVARRHLTKGQRAMAVAAAVFLKKTDATRVERQELGAAIGASGSRVDYALAVMNHVPELRDPVLAGTLALNEAYEAAKRRKEEAESAEERAERDRRRLAELRIAAPDLAERVADDGDRLTLGEAWTLWQERVRDRRELDERTVAYFENAVTMLWSILHLNPEEVVDRWIDGRIQKMTVESLRHLQTGGGLRELARLVEACAAAVDRRGGVS